MLQSFWLDIGICRLAYAFSSDYLQFKRFGRQAFCFHRDRNLSGGIAAADHGQCLAVVGRVGIFSYADINRYEGRGDNEVKYYDRSDWANTVSLDRENGAAKVVATEQMAHDILKQCPVEYNIPLDKDAEATAYPTYGKQAGISLVDMRTDENGNDIDFNDPLWDTFMDQLTWEETATLVSTGYHNTALVESINKPESNDENGPNGFNRVYNEQKEGLAYVKMEDVPDNYK